ncbi:hypothetical protein E2562_034652 [Oryza meyeriana var. granulata]|uniref:Uncharacterized protein n=1 Tax=Oryza meyeriana var. granulata TaxID=110450 RepID=A0A6G1ECE0_9ORYZ|nr:hypothetical protein E2562_034652 [Oryza meyeriana var. granulata]
MAAHDAVLVAGVGRARVEAGLDAGGRGVGPTSVGRLTSLSGGTESQGRAGAASSHRLGLAAE